MDVRQSIHTEHAKNLDTAGLRREFLIEKIFDADNYTLTYSHIDRIIIVGVMPVQQSLTIGAGVGKLLVVRYFPEPRHMGVIKIGWSGFILVSRKT